MSIADGIGIWRIDSWPTPKEASGAPLYYGYVELEDGTVVAVMSPTLEKFDAKCLAIRGALRAD